MSFKVATLDAQAMWRSQGMYYVLFYKELNTQFSFQKTFAVIDKK